MGSEEQIEAFAQKIEQKKTKTQKIEKMMQRSEDYTRRASIWQSTTQGLVAIFVP